MTNYNIYIISDEHPRTNNTPKNSRTYYTKITVVGKEALVAKVQELRKVGEFITEIATDLGTRLYL